MGTNYYAKIEENKCECCNRADTYKIHIGKKSWGWSFNFRGYRKGLYDDQWKSGEVDVDLTSWREYKEYLADKQIVDEYGDIVSFDEFVKLVEVWGGPEFVREDGHKNLDHNTEIKRDPCYAGTLHDEYNNPEKHWNDGFGYSFGIGEFS